MRWMTLPPTLYLQLYRLLSRHYFEISGPTKVEDGPEGVVVKMAGVEMNSSDNCLC